MEVGAFYASFRDVPGSAWRWEHFKPAEIACKGSGALLLIPDAMDALERARVADGKPFRILSAYRSPLHNARVGGAPKSAHKDGTAFDIALGGRAHDTLIATCRIAGFGSFGRYKTFLHVDLRRGRSWNS